MGLIFWVFTFWLRVSEEEIPPFHEGGISFFFLFIMAPWLGMLLNAYLIIRLTKEPFNKMTTFSLMLFISGTSALKLVAAFYGADLYQEHFRAFEPETSLTPCFFILVAAILELFIILGILRFYCPDPLHLKKFIPITLLLITFGDVFWWSVSSFVWIIFHMGGIAG